MPIEIRLTAVAVLSICTMAFVTTSRTSADTLTLQQGVNGYERARDTSIRWAYTTRFGDTGEMDLDHQGDAGAYEMWSTGAGRASVLEVGNFFQRVLGTIRGGNSTMEAGPTYRYSRMYIRFRDVYGTGVNQVPLEAEITSATLKLYNTFDLGAEVSAGGAFLGDTVLDADNNPIANPHAAPKMNAGTIAIYPSLIPIVYGFDDGTAKKGVVTGRNRRRDKEAWSLGVIEGPTCQDRFSNGGVPNDAFEIAFNCGPGDSYHTTIPPGSHEIDSAHPGVVEVFQDASEGFKEFDVSGLMEFITGNGVFITALSPPGELPTMDLNYGNAYHSSEFGNTYDRDGNLITGASAEQIATRPILMIELGGSTVPGDANGDGVVDVADLGIMGANFGSTNAVTADGDFSGDSIVDVADLGIMGANWSASQSTGNATALVPEPATLSLLAMSVLVVGRRRR